MKSFLVILWICAVAATAGSAAAQTPSFGSLPSDFIGVPAEQQPGTIGPASQPSGNSPGDSFEDLLQPVNDGSAGGLLPTGDGSSGANDPIPGGIAEPIPEPETLAMMMTGLACMLVVARRRRSS